MSHRFPALQWHAHRRALRAATFAMVLGAMLLPVVPSVSAATTCERTFTGDATGSRDVTASLTAFLDKHGGKRLCLKAYGRYRIDGTVRITNEYGLRLNGRNAVLRPRINRSSTAQRQHLRIESSRNVIIKNLNVRGLNPNHRHWVAARQQEHGIALLGGDNLKIYNVTVRDTYGDGIYVSYIPGRIAPPTRITLDRVNIARVGRNGIAIVGGSYLLVSGAVVSGTGLHSIDLEPDLVDANIHHVTVRRSSLRGFGQSDAYDGYAFAANGKAGSMSALTIKDNRADRFQTTVQNRTGGTHRNIVFTGNRSDFSAQAYFANVDGLTFSGNVNISARKSNVD